MITLQDFCDILSLEINIKYYPNQNGRWSASIKGAEMKEKSSSCGLLSEYGSGKSPEAAINDYISKIIGKLMVINATGDDRREHVVPVIQR